MFKYIRDEYTRDDFVLRALQSKAFMVGNIEYIVISHGNEGFNLAWDDGMALGEAHCTSLLQLLKEIGDVYDKVDIMSLSQLRDAFIAVSNDCDRDQLKMVYTNIGYLNCQIGLGYEPTDDDLALYRRDLKDLSW